MIADAVILILIAIAFLILLAEDCFFDSWPMRPMGIAFGFFSFMRAVEMLGHWNPSPDGFPISRIALDGLLFAMIAVRTFAVLADRYRRFSRRTVRGIGAR